MQSATAFDRVFFRAKQNKWIRSFTVFIRVLLAIGFLPSGFVKIIGERFTSLSVNHPMGNYLEALHHTGFYYTFIGVLQVTAAILLLIPRTALLGALLYFPIILNICILSLAVRFEGSLLTSPLMVLANLYLLCWDYDRLKFILSFHRPASVDISPEEKRTSNKFAWKFFAAVFTTVLVVALCVINLYDIQPHNTLRDCATQCPDAGNPKACEAFCNCIHEEGRPLNECLEAYQQAAK